MIRYFFGVSISLVLCIFIFYLLALGHTQRININDLTKKSYQFYTLYKPKSEKPKPTKTIKKKMPKIEKKPPKSSKPQSKAIATQTTDKVQDIAEEVVDVTELDQAVQIIRPIIPRYPDIAQKAGIEATVMLNLIVNEKGSVEFVTVVYCSKPGYNFEKNAIDAAKKLRFEPFLKNGNPVKVTLVYPIQFVLIE